MISTVWSVSCLPHVPAPCPTICKSEGAHAPIKFALLPNPKVNVRYVDLIFV